jgi:hypothetical protein
MRLTLDKSIRIYMRVAYSTVGMNFGWLLIERLLVNGTFRRRRVNIWLFLALLTLKFRPHATNYWQVHSNIYESGLLHCQNGLWLVIGRAAACTRYVSALTLHYLALSHTKVSAACDKLLTSPFEYIWEWHILLSEWIVVGYWSSGCLYTLCFGCWRVTISLSHTKVSAACD